MAAAGRPSSGGWQQQQQQRGAPRLFLLSLGLVLLLAPAPTQQFDYKSILTKVITGVATDAFQTGELELLDHYCSYSTKPHFYRWRLYYRSQIWCPGWTPIIGKSSGSRNPLQSRNEATKDFMRKSLNTGLVTREEAKQWL